jgi:hypothetical protein
MERGGPCCQAHWARETTGRKVESGKLAKESRNYLLRASGGKRQHKTLSALLHTILRPSLQILFSLTSFECTGQRPQTAGKREGRDPSWGLRNISFCWGPFMTTLTTFFDHKSGGRRRGDEKDVSWTCLC